MGEYHLSVLAEQDLDDILEYTWDRFGEHQAFKYVRYLNKHLGMLADNPQLASERIEFDPPVRIFLSGGYYIVYLEWNDGIQVVRLLHNKMDLKRHL